MHRARLAAPAMLLAIAWSSAATAQTSDIQVGVLAFPGHVNPTLTNLGNPMGSPIVTADCDQSITFRFQGVDTSRINLEWFQGSMCDDPNTRNSTTQTNCQRMSVPNTPTNNRAMVDATVAVRDLVPCGSGTTGSQNVFVLALSNTTDTVSGAGQKATFPLAFDFAGPAAPAGFTASGGEAAHLHWQASSDQVTTYLVYIDPNGCSPDGAVLDVDAAAGGFDAGGFDAGALDASMSFDASLPDAGVLMDAGPLADASVDAGIFDPTQIPGPGGAPIATTGGSSTSVDVPFPGDVPYEGMAAVAIRALDRSGNPSALSNVVCVQRYHVTSWWDMRCAGTSPPPDCTSSGCSVTPPRTESALGLAGIALAAIAIVIRRSRR